MSTLKDLFENEELMNNLVEDIEDFAEDSEVIYAVWALGYTGALEITDTEILVGEFTNPDEAVACAEELTIDSINKIDTITDTNIAYFSIEVETVVTDPNDADGGTINIGTVYQRALWIDREHSSEERLPDTEKAITSPVVAILPEDYILLEDGTLKINCILLPEFNTNDQIMILFANEATSTPLPYQIISKVKHEDGEYFHCELQI